MRLTGPAVLAVAVLLLVSLVCGTARGNVATSDDFPNNILDRFSGMMAQRGGPATKQLIPFKDQFQSYGKVGMIRYHTGPRSSGVAFAARWLSSLRCKTYRKSISLVEPGPPSFWEYVSEAFRVDIAWSAISAGMFRTFVQSSWPWKQTTALLSVSQRSWTIMHATDLEKWFQKYLSDCISDAPHPEPVGLEDNFEYHAAQPDYFVEAMAANAAVTGIEQLHLDVDQGGRNLEGSVERLVLPDTSFEKLTNSLVAAPRLREVWISWNSSRATSETVSRVQGIMASLSKNPSLKKLTIVRLCDLGRGPAEPLAALGDGASIPGAWANVETLSIIRYKCVNEGETTVPPELISLPVLTARMPVLRRVHIEYHGREWDWKFGRWDPDLGNIAPLLPAHVVVTVARVKLGTVGVAHAGTLAPLGDAYSNGHAMVLSAPDLPNAVAPLDQMLLAGHEVLDDTTALTILPVFVYYEGYFDKEYENMTAFEPLDNLAAFLPSLERLAIDSRWSGSGSTTCNKYLAILPEIAGRLRALMLHTIEFVWQDGRCMAYEALQETLQAGRDLSVVELGISLPSPITRMEAVLVENIADTLSRMRRLESVSLTLTGARGRDALRYRELHARFLEIVPFARFTVVGAPPVTPEKYTYLRGERWFTWWQFNMSAPVPPTPAFPSPWQFYGAV